MFITADEPVEVRRKNTLKRLKYRAEPANQRVLVPDGILFIEDVTVFSLSDGYIRNLYKKLRSLSCIVMVK